MTSGWRVNDGSLLTIPSNFTILFTRSNEPSSALKLARQLRIVRRAPSACFRYSHLAIDLSPQAVTDAFLVGTVTRDEHQVAAPHSTEVVRDRRRWLRELQTKLRKTSVYYFENHRHRLFDRWALTRLRRHKARQHQKNGTQISRPAAWRFDLLAWS